MSRWPYCLASLFIQITSRAVTTSGRRRIPQALHQIKKAEEILSRHSGSSRLQSADFFVQAIQMHLVVALDGRFPEGKSGVAGLL